MTWDSEVFWRRLRGMRSSPPGHASRGDRRHTFSAALEQAEQLLRSAATMGPETRPINLYYGLSQGARAVAAALDPDDSWRLRGHGVDRANSLDRAITTILLRDTPEDRGSFTRLAVLLGSPSLPHPVELGSLLAALPLAGPVSSWSDRPRGVTIENVPQSGGAILTMSRDVYARSKGWAVLPGIREMTPAERRDALAAYIRQYYPTLHGFEPIPPGHEAVAIVSGEMQFLLRYEADESIGWEPLREQVLYSRSVPMGGHQVVLPALGSIAAPAAESAATCHPTIVLWACLWTMSMLARYEPVRWAKALDVDRNGDAVALEEVLDDAFTMVPWSLVDALERA